MSRGHIKSAADQVRVTARLAEVMLAELKSGWIWRLVAANKTGLQSRVEAIRRTERAATTAKSADTNKGSENHG